MEKQVRFPGGSSYPRPSRLLQLTPSQWPPLVSSTAFRLWLPNGGSGLHGASEAMYAWTSLSVLTTSLTQQQLRR